MGLLGWIYFLRDVFMDVLFCIHIKLTNRLPPHSFIDKDKRQLPKGSTVGSWAMLKQHIGRFFNENIRHNSISKGDMAENVKLFHMDGKTECNLLDFLKAARPLVVNFGSNT